MPQIMRSENIGCRTDLAGLCNTLHITRAVEVGTDRGVFARQFLELWRGSMLICVDNWAPYPEMEWDRMCDMIMAVGVLSPYADRCRIIRGDSRGVIPMLQRIPFDPGFVYIDADHEHDAVLADMNAWWPVINPGGIMAGHDFHDATPGVKSAVTEFAKKHGLAVRLTTDHNAPPSWYIHKGDS